MCILVEGHLVLCRVISSASALFSILYVACINIYVKTINVKRVYVCEYNMKYVKAHKYRYKTFKMSIFF